MYQLSTGLAFLSVVSQSTFAIARHNYDTVSNEAIR